MKGKNTGCLDKLQSVHQTLATVFSYVVIIISWLKVVKGDIIMYVPHDPTYTKHETSECLYS